MPARMIMPIQLQTCRLPTSRLMAPSLFFLLLFSGCGSQTDRGEIDEPAEASTPAAPPGATSAPNSVIDALSPQAFVTQIGTATLYEIAAARVVDRRTKSNAVRDYANRVAAERKAAFARLREFAAQSEAELVVPGAPDDIQRAAVAALEKASNFDSLYVQQQRRAQEQTLGDLRRYASKGEGEALRAFAEELAGTVTRHRALLRMMDQAAPERGASDQLPSEAGVDRQAYR